MKLSIARGALVALGLTCGSALNIYAQEGGYGAPSLLPMPSARQVYQVQPVAAFKRFQAEEAGPSVGSPARETVVTHGGEPLPAPTQSPVQAEPTSPYEAAMGGAWGDGGYSGSDGCTDGGCADACNVCAPCTCWWTNGGFLWMGRNREDMHQISFNTNDPLGAVLTTDSANMNFSPGFQASIGRWFGCGAWGVEATYWGVFPQNQEETAYGGVPSNMNSVFDFGTLNINGTNLNTLYDNAQAHRVQRSWQFHNVELNALQGQVYSWDNSYSCLNVGLIGGIRYFRFDEGFQYATSQNSPIFGVDPNGEAFYDIDIQNHLVGGQIGARGNLLLGQRARLHATPKFGVFNNHITQIQRIWNQNGTAVVNVGNPLAGTPYDINNSKDEIAFLAELDVGLDYRISHHWSLNVGYRMVAITNVAFATTQIPVAFPDIPGAQDIKNDEALYLHGGYVGATFAW